MKKTYNPLSSKVVRLLDGMLGVVVKHVGKDLYIVNTIRGAEYEHRWDFTLVDW